MTDSQPLFVRLPVGAATHLDRMVSERGATKREIVTRLILDGDAPRAEPAVLSPAQAAELLQVGEPLVVELAETGELPGRTLGGQWRFSRAALLGWLANDA